MSFLFFSLFFQIEEIYCGLFDVIVLSGFCMEFPPFPASSSLALPGLKGKMRIFSEKDKRSEWAK